MKGITMRSIISVSCMSAMNGIIKIDAFSVEGHQITKFFPPALEERVLNNYIKDMMFSSIEELFPLPPRQVAQQPVQQSPASAQQTPPVVVQTPAVVMQQVPVQQQQQVAPVQTPQPVVQVATQAAVAQPAPQPMQYWSANPSDEMKQVVSKWLSQAAGTTQLPPSVMAIVPQIRAALEKDGNGNPMPILHNGEEYAPVREWVMGFVRSVMQQPVQNMI
jgi:hypothetical protein